MKKRKKYRINYIKFFISLTIFILVISISVITIKKLVNKSVENKRKFIWMSFSKTKRTISL